MKLLLVLVRVVIVLRVQLLSFTSATSEQQQTQSTTPSMNHPTLLFYDNDDPMLRYWCKRKLRFFNSRGLISTPTRYDKLDGVQSNINWQNALKILSSNPIARGTGRWRTTINQYRGGGGDNNEDIDHASDTATCVSTNENIEHVI